MKTWLFIFFLLGAGVLCCDVKGTQGYIDFDANADQQREARLDGTGLKIGSSAPSANLDVSGNGIITGTIAIGTTTAPSSNLWVEGTWAITPPLHLRQHRGGEPLDGVGERRFGQHFCGLARPP